VALDIANAVASAGARIDGVATMAPDG
jgi:hypothetical protein